MDGDERIGPLLLRLPSLTKLHLLYREDAAQVDFLPQLPLLTELSLDCYNRHGECFIPADAVLASLVLCNGITELTLTCGFNSAHLSVVFANLTKLKTLTISRGALETLQCFASGPITQSLEDLTIENLHLPPSEVSYLYALRRLHTLHLLRCFSSPLDEATIDSLFPPTPHLPALTYAYLQWRLPERKLETVVRPGPSFERSQQRLSQ